MEKTDSQAASSVAQTLPGWAQSWFADPFWGPLLGVLLLVAGALLLHLVTQRLLLRGLDALFRRSWTWWDNVLMEHRVFHRLAWLLPVMVIATGVALIPGLDENWVQLVRRITHVCVVLTLALALTGLTSAINAIYSRYPVSRNRPVKGYLQIIVIVAWVFAGILIVATLLQQSPWFFLSGLGAMTAILLLIFRDTLLSLVAGIQLSANDLIRVGDWIEMPQFGADGDVVDIGLHQVRVSNWDRTTTTIPTHKFLEHSFRNWRGMFDAGGRRIKRAINIDLNTVAFLSPETLAHLGEFELLKDYLQGKQQDVDNWNREHAPAGSPLNQRRLTNLGTFRAYVSAWLRAHPLVHAQMTFLVRQLAPGPEGLPLEIYVFSRDTRWSVYEDLQSDIFDHLLAILPEFGLRVFQQPTGSDFGRWPGPAGAVALPSLQAETARPGSRSSGVRGQD